MTVRQVKEKDFNEFTLFFTCVDIVEEENTVVVTYRFVPRAYQGNVLHDGFEFTYRCDGTWKNFEQEVLTNPDWISFYWRKYRKSSSAEKMWFKVIKCFQEVYDDCPYRTSSTDFGRLVVPEDYMNLVTSIVGSVEAWDYKE